MPIRFDETRGQFYLHTDHASYIIELLDGRIPMHAHWGGRLDTMEPMSSFLSTHHSNFVALDTGAESPLGSTDSLQLEYPVYGTSDLRQPALHVQFADGTRIQQPEYVSHTIRDGKPALEGLPATYGDAEDVQTLEITLRDAYSGLTLLLQYSVFPAYDAITRSAKIVNGGKDAVKLLKVMSANVDFYERPLDMMHLWGIWARERHVERLPLGHSGQRVSSARGASGHEHNPFFALLDPTATETTGEVYGFSLVYSGNFEAGAEPDAFGFTRAAIGINSFDFSWELTPQASFQTPEAVLVYSAEGIGEMSRRYHRLYREHLCRGEYQFADRPVLVNNWEATYFNFNEEKLLTIAAEAKKLDIDMLVLDDGWFGKRDNDNCSLGDWVCNTDKLKGGLKSLGDRLTEMGLRFGLWFEPEMISPDSDLYRAHPDWCIHVPGRPRHESRTQLILDLSRPEVQDYVIGAVSAVLDSAPISYVKWDMNRSYSDIGSAYLDAAHQQELPHRYMLGLYRILDAVTSAHPHILFESCSGGGGRFDPGMLYYMPQTWCSDDSDAVERLYIQYGTSMVYPSITMGAHVSVCPNHQIGRTTPFAMRGNVAMSGQFGYELDLSKLSDEDRALAKEQVAFYKAHRHTVQHGDMFRLCSPFEEPFAAWEFRSPDEKEVLLFGFNIAGRAIQSPKRVKLQGLDTAASYRDEATGRVYSGAFLAQIGIPFERAHDYQNAVYVFRKEN